MASVVTLSLPDLCEQLKTILPPQAQPTLDELLALATDEKNHEAVKEWLTAIATADQLRRAVNQLVERLAAPNAAPSSSTANASPPAASSAPPPPVPPPQPAPPPAMPATEPVFPPGTKNDDILAALVHSVHCRTPSCPVPRCAIVSAKLVRLHEHVSECTLGQACKLCSMWTALKYYGSATTDAAAGGGDSGVPGGLCKALYADTLLKSSLLLPRWHDEKVVWIPAAEALTQLQELTSLEDIKKPRRMGSGTMSGVAGGAGSSDGGGTSDGKLRLQAAEKITLPTGSMERNAQLATTDAGSLLQGLAVNANGIPRSWACLEAQMLAGAEPGPSPLVSWSNTNQFKAQMADARVELGADAQASRSPNIFAGVPLQHNRTSNLNLTEILQSASLSDLGLSKNRVISDLGLGHIGPSSSFVDGIGFTRNRSQLRTINVSNMSIGSLLEQTSGGEITDILSEFEPR